MSEDIHTAQSSSGGKLDILYRVVFVLGGTWLLGVLVFPAYVMLRILGFDSPSDLATHYINSIQWLVPTLVVHPFLGLEAFVLCFFSCAIATFFIRKRWKSMHLPAFGRARPDSDLHGSARWATLREVKKMALLPPGSVALPDSFNERLMRLINTGFSLRKFPHKPHGGVFVGAYENPQTRKTEYLRHDGPEHVLAFAPTRSGKGVGLVLPTLLSWEHSTLVHDPKGEAWALTAGFRSKGLGQKVFRFDPADPDTRRVAAYNPLAEIRLGTSSEVGDAQNIATILADPEGKGLSDHWAKTAWSLLSAIILHCRYAAHATSNTVASFKDVTEYLCKPGMDIQQQLLGMRDALGKNRGYHPMITQEAQSMINKESRELASVVSTAVSLLTLYRDPVLAENTGRSDWRIRDLMFADRPASAYLVIRPSEADRLRPLIRLIATQIVRTLTEKMEFKDGRSFASYNHRLLLMMDEFTALKKLPVVEEALAYMAGYGLKCYLIVQDIEQLKAVYGREETVLSNCHIRLCYAPNKYETAEMISKMAGQRTIVHKAAKVKKGGEGDKGQTWQETSRPLVTPEEVMRLAGAEKDETGNIVRAGELLVFTAGHRPIKCRQALYFMDQRLNERSRMNPPDIFYTGMLGWAPGDVFDVETMHISRKDLAIPTIRDGTALQDLEYPFDELFYEAAEDVENPHDAAASDALERAFGEQTSRASAWKSPVIELIGKGCADLMRSVSDASIQGAREADAA